MNACKRIHALLLCIGFILVLSVSSAFLIHEADHDCCGEDCPVCQTIAMTTALLRVLCLIVFAALLFAVSTALSALRAPEGNRRHAAGTPVSWKIRLNN